MTLTNPPFSSGRPEAAVDIEAAALTWAAKADRGPLSGEDQAALEAWAEADPRRAGAYARALAANAYFDRAAALGSDFRPKRPALGETLDRRRVMTAGGALLAASVVAGVGLATLSGRGRIATPKGDVRRVSLPEGSAVTLNTDTAIRPVLGLQMRRVDLLKGEALFDVAKDSARPFVVFARDIQIRAIGTSFTVRVRDDHQVEVAVREGIVEVSRAAQAAVQLSAAMTALASPTGDIARAVSSLEALERAVAWREGRLDLAGMSLAAAAAEFGRYSDRPILIEDPAVAAMTVTGVYSVSDPEGFARAAALSLGLVATSAPDGIRLGKSGLS